MEEKISILQYVELWCFCFELSRISPGADTVVSGRTPDGLSTTGSSQLASIHCIDDGTSPPRRVSVQTTVQ